MPSPERFLKPQRFQRKAEAEGAHAQVASTARPHKPQRLLVLLSGSQITESLHFLLASSHIPPGPFLENPAGKSAAAVSEKGQDRRGKDVGCSRPPPCLLPFTKVLGFGTQVSFGL